MKRIYTLVLILLALTGQITGQSWSYVNSTGTTFILYGMSFPSGQSTIGYACGMQYTYNADGVIIKTTDGGDNWTEILPTSGTINGLQGIWFISETVGFAGGWNDYFIKTTDGGATWTQINQGANAWYYKDVEFWDANNGVAVASMNSGSDQSVFITSDGGNTWTPCTSGMANASIMGLSYADANTIYAVGTDAKVHKSTDGGDNWTEIYTLPALLFGVEFADANFGVVGGEEKIFATNDGGTSWTTFTTGYENFYATHALTNGTAYVGGTDENIYTTTDYGVTWTTEHNGTGTSSLYRIRETESTALFACGSQGTIITREAQFGADFIASEDSVCIVGSVDFTDMSIGNITSWNWTFEGGTPATSTDQNPTVSYDTEGSYGVTLEVSDGTSTDTKYIPNMIHVLDDPVAPGIPSGLTAMCAGETTDYTISPVSGSDYYFWEVTPSDAGTISGSGTTGTFVSDNDFTGTYWVKVKANNMCGNGPWSDSLECELDLLPQSFVLSEGGGYCQGDPGIELTLDGSETGIDYELFLDDVTTGIIEPGTGSSISFGYQTAEGIYTAKGSTGVCEEWMIGTPYIYELDMPEQGNTPVGNDDVCSGAIEDYTIDEITNADSVIWVLEPSEAGIITGSGLTVTVEWDVDFSGNATLTTQGTNDCGSGDVSSPLEVSISLSPTPEITGLTMVCDEEENEYETLENAGSTYEWTITGGEIVSGAGTHIVNVLWGQPGMGTVQVMETSDALCVGTSEELEVTIDDCTGIDEIIESELSIYPNPVKGTLNISVSIIENENYNIEITNLLGQDVKSITGKGDGTLNKYQLDTRDMPEGQYFVSISTESGAYMIKKLVVVK